jgi:hydroxymethylglutaryl-CoA reductase
LKALVTSGIQHGHMRLHARQIALAAGAKGEQIEEVSRQLIADGNIRVAYAAQLLRGASHGED